jgi:asparagine synthase (glutamine-hydrolysing)
MMGAAAHRGPDGSAVWLSGPAGLGHLLLVTGTPGEALRQPLVASDGAIAVSFVGHLHDARQLEGRLAREVRLAALTPGSATDAELVLAAYEAWGEGCPAQLLGEFAFVLWDGTRGRLLAARDATGTRTIFYSWDGRTLLLASEPGQLLAHPRVGREPDEDAIGNMLRNRFTDLTGTFHRDVRRLPPAHLLTLDQGRLQVQRYWDVNPLVEVRHPRDEDYADEFRGLFETAVARRLQSSRPVGCLFSGGLDSSAVISGASRVAPAAGVRLKGYAMVFEEAPVDDRVFIEAVQRMHGVEVEVCRPPRHGPLRDLEEVISCLDSPLVDAHYPMLAGLFGAAQRDGCRLLLTGLRGDDAFGGLGYLADLAARLRLRTLTRELRAWSEVVGDSLPHLAWRFSARPALRGRGRFRSRAQREAHELALGSFTVLTTEMMELYAGRFGLVPSHPFWDRDLVEFMLAIPPELKTWGGETKRLLRRSLRGVVPDVVLDRRDKLNLTPFFRRGLAVYDRALLIDSLSSLHPTLSRQTGARDAPRLVEGFLADRPVPLLRLWFMICINTWLNEPSGGGRPLGPRAANPKKGASI